MKTIELEFLEFDLQEGHDSLFIYQGTSLADPLIGAFTGNTLPQIPGTEWQFNHPEIYQRWNSD